LRDKPALTPTPQFRCQPGLGPELRPGLEEKIVAVAVAAAAVAAAAVALVAAAARVVH
jgi:hypothetical protein